MGAHHNHGNPRSGAFDLFNVVMLAVVDRVGLEKRTGNNYVEEEGRSHRSIESAARY